jgi:hypothetical protein
MLERSSTSKPRDLNDLAAAIMGEATGETPAEEPDDRDPNAVALGWKGGARGVPARAASLIPERHREIAKKPPARWDYVDETTDPSGAPS